MAARADLLLVHLYPDLLRTYGDRGNILALCRRAEWRELSVEVAEVTRGERIPEGAGIVLLGGGTDRVQEFLAADLAGRRSQLEDVAARGVVLGVCGGYQFLGHRYVMPDGTEVLGLGLLDVETRAEESRIVGNVRAVGRLWNRSFELFGFENHGGRTRLGAAAVPLAITTTGHGNNGEDETEGAVQGGFVGTYLHGPVLPSNPELTDALLERALGDGAAPLAPLDDELEAQARAEARARTS
jgi:CobQ-like glutamine amidotransferase family enzyme